MSGQSSEPVFAGIVEHRGAERTIDGHIIACCASRDNTRFAFATGEGDLIIADRTDLKKPEAWKVVEAHDGPVLALAPDVAGNTFLTGGEDCRLARVSPEASETLTKNRRWVEHVVSWSDGKTKIIACASGKDVQLRKDDGTTLLRTLEHPSTVSGITFDAKGKRIAASHYNGASLWFVQSKENKPRLLEWKGSHLGVVIHPAGEALVTSMQENDLHGWRLSDGHNMRMSGYPTKVASLAFTRNGKWLATGGSDSVVLWPFFGGGPMGKPPSETPGIPGVLCTRVATHPTQDLLVAGFANGAVLMIDYNSQRVLPVCAADESAVTALAISADGCTLGYGTENGRIGLVDLTAGD
ncbi:WD40 repeat domain-containing protein [Acetobacter fallax]|uniref:WD40 repeat domain-containing protein n=1 Tax=Acetobacter fallax TaxID=1737473 RepID=A0ABX0KA99_9PROT|nr:WD40 repeat domain-containing protein [Acetobacter fallax]NHO32133.1 WD40 repeat domain-containing protein [Acetobacter fallax]NHO35596.1 WD40 repeat domain-containing protein [Acetobacter fallax]